MAKTFRPYVPEQDVAFRVLAGGFLVANSLFAAAYLACGRGPLTGADELGPVARAFFFSDRR